MRIRDIISEQRRRSATGWRGLAGGAAALFFVLGLLPATRASGQAPPGGDRYYPLNHRVAPGVAGRWSVATQPDRAGYFQPVRVELPVAGEVSFYGRPQDAVLTATAPAAASMQLGRVYRIRIANLPDFPGVELYPTIELLDRLHPPAGKVAEYPVPITFNMQELRFAMEGRLVTKVVYLEQPDRAEPQPAEESAPTRYAGRLENALAVADELGRPMAIVRLGGRLPDPDRPDPEFFGGSAPVLPIRSAKPPGPVASAKGAPQKASPAAGEPAAAGPRIAVQKPDQNAVDAPLDETREVDR